MAGVISTASYLKALAPGVAKWWDDAGRMHPVEWTSLVHTTTSSRNYEEVVQDTPFGLVPVKDQAAPAVFDTLLQGFTTRATMLAYALGYIVTHEEVQDNQYPTLIQRRTMKLRNAFEQTRERVVANVYNRAFNSTYLGGDGICLLSTAHPNTFGGTFANKAAVDADFSEAAVEDMIILIDNAADDRGNLIGLRKESLIIPTALQFQAQRVLKSPYQPGTANNDISVLYATNPFPKGIIVNHYLTSTTNWFIRTDIGPEEGLTMWDREPLRLTQDNDFQTMNGLHLGYMRFAVSWANPKCLYGSNAP